MEKQTIWEVVDNDFVDLACAECAHKFLTERGVSDHAVGENYYNADDGIYAVEDVFGEYADQGHTCSGCNTDLV